MIRVKKYASSYRLVISISLPRFKRLKRFAKTMRLYLKKRQTQLDRIATASLCVVGVAGVVYTTLPLQFQSPVSAVETPAVTLPEVQPTQITGLSRSVPVHLEAPDINLSTSIITTGKTTDGSLAVPERYDVAAWYEFSPTPGEIGPAIIVGHVDTYMGAAVFFRLKELQPGHIITLTRDDGSTARFAVERVALYDQANFPTNEVYGNIDYSGLRLITCGGVFNPLTGYYLQNTVVFARFIQ